MRLAEFHIGLEFWCGGKRWRCTDVGSRVVVTISLEPHEVVAVEDAAGLTGPTRWRRFVTDEPSWLVGPPFGVAQDVFVKTRPDSPVSCDCHCGYTSSEFSIDKTQQIAHS